MRSRTTRLFILELRSTRLICLGMDADVALREDVFGDFKCYLIVAVLGAEEVDYCVGS